MAHSARGATACRSGGTAGPTAVIQDRASRPEQKADGSRARNSAWSNTAQETRKAGCPVVLETCHVALDCRESNQDAGIETGTGCAGGRRVRQHRAQPAAVQEARRTRR